MALRKEPSRRYGSVVQFADDLRRHLEGRPVLARRDSLGYRASKFVTRHKTAVVSAVAAVMATVAVVAVAPLISRDQGLSLASMPRIRSVAVLPLDNLSQDPDQEYFSDGMTEALISDLAKIRALRVISRTSVMRYKDTQKSLPEIARELNVDAVIEGAVLQSGQRIRITAQLIDAATERHLWNESYERDVRDVLALQSEVARAVAREIEVTVTPQEDTRLANTRRVDPEAHQLYLWGRHHLGKRTKAGTDERYQLLRARHRERPDLRAGVRLARASRIGCPATATTCCRSEKPARRPGQRRLEHCSSTTVSLKPISHSAMSSCLIGIGRAPDRRINARSS